jgi:3-hydroxyacyl-[acyl-carrier-protein] dehydratase
MDAELLVPHRRPTCMIDRLIEYKDESGVIEALIRSGNLLLGEGGVLDRTAYIELIAQAYAAFKGYRDLLHKTPIKKGFLVIVKRMEFKGEAFLGDLIQINVSTVSEVGDFAVAEGTVTRNGDIIASGSLTLWIP